MKYRPFVLVLASAFVLAASPSLSAAPKEWTVAKVASGKPVSLKFTPVGNGETLRVVVSDGTNKEVSRFKLEMRRGLDKAALTACKAQELVGHAKTVAGCLSTGVSGVCLFTGLGGGAGAGVCVASIEYAASGGAVDCVKGLAGQIAKMIGEEQGFEFYQNANFTPGDLVERSIEQMCETWKQNAVPTRP